MNTTGGAVASRCKGAVRLAAWLVLAAWSAGCSSEDRPAFTDESWGKPSASKGSEEDPEQGAGGAPTDGTPPVGQLPMGDVYLWGELRTPNAPRPHAIAPVTAPNAYVYGAPGRYDDYESGVFGSDIVYGYRDFNQQTKVWTYHVPSELVRDLSGSPPPDEATYPENPEENDKQLPTECTGTSFVRWFMAPRRVLYYCRAAVGVKAGWYDQKGVALRDDLTPALVAVTTGGSLGWYRESGDGHPSGVVGLSTGKQVEVTQVADWSYQVFSRASGFRLLKRVEGASMYELWSVGSDANPKLVGTFPPLPQSISGVSSEVLASDDSLVAIVNTKTSGRGLLRRTLDGQADLFYEQPADSFLMLETATLFGPPSVRALSE